ncbi:hypothetical protein JOD27_000027 [Lentzea nigeriaca]|nr:hypothetical protein [Lentzea nigeriaca]
MRKPRRTLDGLSRYVIKDDITAGTGLVRVADISYEWSG